MKHGILFISVLFLMFSCTQRRYANRTTIFHRTQTIVKSGQKPRVLFEKSDHNNFKSLDSLNLKGLKTDLLGEAKFSNLIFQPNGLVEIVKSEKRAGVSNKELTKKLLKSYTRSSINQFNSSLLKVVSAPVQIVRKVNQHKNAKPRSSVEDTIITIFAILLLLGVIFGIVLLLNRWFFHMTMKELGKAVLGVLFGILIVALLLTIFAGPDA